jgi:general secretion pathway protein L
MTTCRIRVTRDTPASGSFEWVTLGPQGNVLASGSANLARAPVSGSCELVLASDLVLLERVAAPASQQRRLGHALRYLVEEVALTDPERLHVTAAPGATPDTLCLGVVDRQWLSELLDKVRGAGLVPDAAYPESLLATQMPHTWTVVWRGSDGFARTGESEAFSLDITDSGSAPTNLRLALEAARTSGGTPHALVVRCTRQASPPDTEAWSTALGLPVELGPEWHWADAQRRPVLELLQGEFAVRGSSGPWLRRLRRPAILAGALIALASFALALDWGSKVRERNAILGEMHSIYRETFGDKATIVDAPLQMGRALAELRQRTGEVAPGDFLALLGVAADLLTAESRRSVRELAYDGTTLSVTLRAAAAEESAALLKQVRSRPLPLGYELAANPSSKGDEVTLRLRARRGP